MIVELPASLEPMKLSLVLVSLLMWEVPAELVPLNVNSPLNMSMSALPAVLALVNSTKFWKVNDCVLAELLTMPTPFTVRLKNENE